MSSRARRAFIREHRQGIDFLDDSGLDFALVEQLDGFSEEIGARYGDYPIGLEDGQDESVEWETVESNAAQSRMRNAAKSGDYNTIFAAGTISSSKTFGIAMIINEMAMDYPETEVLVVRPRRDQLEDSTIPDFLASLPPDQILKFNRSRLVITLKNYSRIRFRISNEQNDKGFLWLKGNKPDILFVDECDGVTREFISMARSRVGIQRKRRRKAAKVCPPMTFLACNPNIAWPKEYYTLHVHQPAKLLEQRTYFQKFTIEDNAKHISREKIEAWKREFTPPMFKRFVEGSWDAMADREQLFLYEYMDKCSVRGPNGEARPKKLPPLDAQGSPGKWPYYLGVDPARFGPDKCAFLIMHGPNLHRLEFFATSDIPQIEMRILEIMGEFKITPNNVTVDAEGLGAGVVDNLGRRSIWVNEFRGSASPDFEAVNYTFSFGNKRAQVFWQVMQWMRDGNLGGFDSLGWFGEVMLDEVLRQDLASIHYGYNVAGRALFIEGKEEIKKRLGRSPDFADVLCMACYSMFRNANSMSTEIFG